jgi:RNA polymerase sigma factor (sigma-70 family)
MSVAEGQMKDRYQKVLDLLDTDGLRLHRLLARLTRRQDVTGDLLQELVIRLCRSRGLDKAKDPFAYAYRAAANLAFEWRRQQRAHVHRAAGNPDAPVAAPSPLGAVIDNEDLARVLDATARLRELMRQVVVLHYLEQMSYEEIARRLGKKPQYLRSLTSKALARLRTLLGNDRNGEIEGG